MDFMLRLSFRPINASKELATSAVEVLAYRPEEDEKMTETMTYPLRLPRSLKRAVERQSKEDRTSINQFVATAVAEKLSALQTADFFADRKARADFKTFDKLMKRRGGRPPRVGDEMPGSKTKAARQRS
jgi:hypothetical protein